MPTEINHGGNIYNMKIGKPYKLSFFPWRTGCETLSHPWGPHSGTHRMRKMGRLAHGFQGNGHFWS